MAYCTTEELLHLTGTKVSEEALIEMIAQADREIDARLYMAGLSPPGANDMLKTASLKLATAAVFTRHRMDGTMPPNLSIGDIGVGDNPDRAIQQLKEDAYAIVAAYIRYAKKDGRGYYVAITNG
ncbi:MAG: hypothetical protein PHS81_04325 [Candidatus Nanoarchaeia archaeon]|nr:hypothetical protein [Candidatus Nanoarchaeia archaeon]